MATVRITLKTNRKLSNGGYPVVIRMAHLKQQASYIRLNGLSVSNLNEWNKQLSRFTPLKEKYKELNTTLTNTEKKIDSIVELLEANNQFSYLSFKQMYLGKVHIDNNVFEAYQLKINKLIQLKKFGTASFYSDSMAAIKKFKRHLHFEEITYQFLQEFTNDKLARGTSGNSIAVYLRGLRAIHYWHCKINNLSQPTTYSRFKIHSLVRPTKKRSLSLTELKDFVDYLPKSKPEQFAKDVFLLSFYLRGANLMDLAKLKTNNIIQDRIEYRRSKTAGLFSIRITPQIQEILDKYKSDTGYLLPIVKEGNPMRDTVRNYNRRLNKYLKDIASKTGLPKGLTSYWARHSFAQAMRESGVNIETISALLGHNDLKTTQVYLRSFGNDELDNITSHVINSLKP